jgi:hypothetical protein
MHSIVLFWVKIIISAGMTTPSSNEKRLCRSSKSANIYFRSTQIIDLHENANDKNLKAGVFA